MWYVKFVNKLYSYESVVDYSWNILWISCVFIYKDLFVLCYRSIPAHFCTPYFFFTHRFGKPNILFIFFNIINIIL